MSINKLPEHTPRMETGPVQFGKDWPGLFIRGDNTVELLLLLKHAMEDGPLGSIYKMQAEHYIGLINEVLNKEGK